MHRFFIITFLCLFSAVSCTKPRSDDGEGVTPPTQSGEFTTDCGTVVGGVSRNPVNASNGTRVTVTGAAAHNAVTINRNGTQQIVKLRALSDSVSSSISSEATNIISDFTGDATLFTDDCSTTLGNGTGAIVGDLIRDNGVSLTERLLKRGAANVQANGTCSDTQVSSCYSALLDQNIQPPAQNVVSNFIWRPETTSDGWLAVLLDPAGATIFVNGDRLVDVGPSEGRGTTGRTNKPGCAFGSNVQVQVFNSSGAIIPFPNGESTYVIPDGCQSASF